MKFKFDLHRNVYLWYATTFFSFAAFILPIWLIFGTDYLNLSYTQAIILGVVPYGLSALLEIPTGSWADRYGRAKVYRMGVTLYALALLSFVFFSNFYVLLAFQIIGSLGLAMQSGPLEALVHDSLDVKDKDKTYQRIAGNRLSLLFISRALTVLIGGALYAGDPRLPFLFAAAFNFIGILISFFFVEVRLEQATANNNFSHIQEVFGVMKKHPKVIAVIALLGLFQLPAEALFVLYQPYLQSIGIGVAEFGFYYFIISVLSALGALTIGRLLQEYSVFTLISFMMFTVVVSVLLLMTRQPQLLYAAVAVSAISFGFTIVILHTSIQEKISSKYQATALSVGTLAITAAYLIGTIGIGIILDVTNIATALQILMVLSITLLTAFLAGYRKLARLN